jgi:elongation factor P
MISTSDFKPNSTRIMWKKEPWVVISFQHVKPGKGGAFLRTKMKNLITGNTLEETFRSGEKFAEPDIEYKQMQFLYSDDMYHFMDPDSFEQVEININQISGIKNYLKETETYNMIYFDGKIISSEPPMFMILMVKETPPGVKGDTAQGGSKPATLETGLVIQVPLFVEENEKIKIDTRENKYIERSE